jgi:hypothetical protein
MGRARPRWRAGPHKPHARAALSCPPPGDQASPVGPVDTNNDTNNQNTIVALKQRGRGELARAKRTKRSCWGALASAIHRWVHGFYHRRPLLRRQE